jgi:hypothetical protein
MAQHSDRPVPITIEPDVSIDLRTAVENLVIHKDQIESWIRHAPVTNLQADWPCSARGTVAPYAFLHRCLPFLRIDSGEKFPALVPLPLVIGDPWRWSATTVTRYSPDELAAYLLKAERAYEDQRDAASYALIAPLGLFVAHEGKNRVRFLRECGATHVPASVSVMDYPPASSIQRYYVDVLGRSEVWAVLNDHWVQRIPLHTLSERVLTAYGVAQPSVWPKTFPALEAVAARFRQDVFTERVDLLKLIDAEHRADEWIQAAITDFLGFRWRPKPLFAGAILFLLSMVLLPVGNPLLRDLGCLLLGVVTGGTLTLLTKWFTIRRRYLGY